ncbi:KPN_02809 family neutral zinc metallopeptidase [Phytohalomonas tamaricis]|uniref:KPN_02809 family neutral zinc metallopeptidase n=1 Tax=Phytohalomonas tamaricis TaxID=2081032 RepID=UPI000D0B551A|nr:neutral zinc metallopeptidase [Phytohalomonas tamaricis]
MKWKRGRRSENVEDRRGRSTGGLGQHKGKLSLAGIALIVVFGLLTYQDPMQILGQVASQLQQDGATQPAPSGSGDDAGAETDVGHGNEQQVDFVRAILGDTEDTWGEVLAQYDEQYVDPKLVLFDNAVNSACGFASSAVGPFYCPGDQQVYLDLGFFNELEQRFQASGDFARAYVIAHEVGHHVQNLIGVNAQVDAARQRGAQMDGATGLSVKVELQADCFAGIWANHAQQRLNWLEEGDVEEAINAANAIGDDHLQQQGQGRVVPDSFTHGTSDQRVRWFKSGLENGNMEQCDTFNAQHL